MIHNAINQPGVTALRSYEQEMGALDSLGPRTRAALNEAPISVLAWDIYREVTEKGFDPREPRIDEAVAVAVRAGCRDLLLQDRDPIDADAGVVPLVPRKWRRS